ncbi:MAG: DUF2029 domain-containing protein [Chloroflexi bacterium]|nr:DUF2029 domain-containing protein [Chloroflexota bacterium]
MTTALRTTDDALARIGLALARFARPVRDGLIIAGLARAAYYFFVQDIQPWSFLGIDARAYWRVDLAHPYLESSVGGISSYLYSPAFAQALAPFGALPFEVFYGLWLAVSLAILWWLVRPWPWVLPILSLPIIYELGVGNVNYLLAAAIVLSFRAPSLWALPVLTKLSLGVGVLWFVVRREWHAVAVFAASLALIVAVSFVLSPSAWMDWVAFLSASRNENDQLLMRFAAAVVLVAFGALTGRPWLVPIAVWLAQPNIILNSWVILLATIRLRDGVGWGTSPSATAA